MGAVASVLVFGSMLLFGVIAVIAGVVGVIVFGRMKKGGRQIGRILSTVSAVVLAIGVLISVAPIGFFSFIIYVNSIPPEGFVETDIVIEENGYQGTRFTADGVVYEVTGFEANYDVYSATAEPVFSYKTAGFLNGSQCGNYYRVENAAGFDLIVGGFASDLFCPASQKEYVLAYYADVGTVWYFCNSDDNAWDIDPEEAFADDVAAAFTILSKSDYEGEGEKVISEDWLPEVEVYSLSPDGLILYDIIDFVFYENAYYLCYSYGTEEDPENGEWVDGCYYPEMICVYELVPIPDAVNAALLEKNK